jgi:hypothetical protein
MNDDTKKDDGSRDNRLAADAQIGIEGEDQPLMRSCIAKGLLGLRQGVGRLMHGRAVSRR